MTILLLFVCLVLPWHIAFSIQSAGWCLAYNWIDFFFLVDLILQFFRTIPETEDVNENTDRGVIAIHYLKGWFIVDVMSITPFDDIIKIFQGTYDITMTCYRKHS